ncbi:acylneuraminate cytidylyltransferase family protein [SAR86 cluster bacterium]|nr:acylneuraminate cytidylyltransferase family protein [SAR86 cluster bacterium]
MIARKSVTVIPARGGSKGIPKKNIADINGKPLLAYAIEASINSKSDETWVSTENDEISEIAKKYGAKVLKRPENIATDDASSESVLLHFIKEVDDFDILIFLQATCPLVEAPDINKALALMENYDSVISVSKFDQMLWMGSKAMYDINNRQRRQNLEQRFVETGSIFMTTKKGLLRSKNRINGKVGFLEVPKWRSIDIDTYEDLEFARKIMKSHNIVKTQ